MLRVLESELEEKAAEYRRRWMSWPAKERVGCW